MKILALHGKQQNGEIFRSRLGRLPQQIETGKKTSNGNNNNSCIIDYVDAPFELSLNHGDSIPMRTWYHRRKDNTVDYDSLEKTLNYLELIWRSKDGYDGIIGFSQGGMIAAIMTSLPHRFPGLQFFIIGGAPDVACLDDTNTSGGGSSSSRYSMKSIHPIDVCSLHLVGLKDQVVAPSSSHALANRFLDPRVIEHEMGHCIPTQAKYLSMMIDFIQQALARHAMKAIVMTHNSTSDVETDYSTTINDHNQSPINNTNNTTLDGLYRCDSDIIATAQAEEYEVLTSMYPSEITMLTQTPPPIICGDVCISLHLQLDFRSTLMNTTKIPMTWMDNIGVDFICPSNYPTHVPPTINITTGALSMFDGFSSVMVLSLTQYMYRSIGVIYNHATTDLTSYIREPCIMVCIQSAYEWFDDQRWLHGSSTIDDDMDGIDSKGDATTTIVTVDDRNDDISEALEKEMIAQATLEACQIAYKHRLSQRRDDDDDGGGARDLASIDNLSDPITSIDSLSSSSSSTTAISFSTTTLPASARGVWSYTVGLVGKPSAGKLCWDDREGAMYAYMMEILMLIPCHLRSP